MNTPSPLTSYASTVITCTSPSEPFTPYEESDVSPAANVTCDDFTSDDISKYTQLQILKFYVLLFGTFTESFPIFPLFKRLLCLSIYCLFHFVLY
jgi:hypothetical protein